MLQDPDIAMLPRLLRLLLLCSFLSATIGRHVSSMESHQENGDSSQETNADGSGSGEFSNGITTIRPKLKESYTMFSDDDGSGSGSSILTDGLPMPDPNQMGSNFKDENTQWLSGNGPPPMWPFPNMTDDQGQLKNRMFENGHAVPPVPPLPDMKICDMLMSGEVPVPAEWVSLFCLCSHCKGTVGPKGEPGDWGPPGPAGSPGRRGRTGFKGPSGFRGRQGIKGQKPEFGQKGWSGAIGFTGTKGDRGFKGDKGEQAQTGPAGAEGPQGEVGTCPAYCGNVQGPPGLQGPAGPAGARGLPGVEGIMGTQGYKGDMGHKGSTGNTGVMGKKGDPGEDGVCDCQDRVDGNDATPGEQGTKGHKGYSGDKGVQGSMGLKGNKGDMGFDGLPGPCSLAIQSAFSACLIEPYPRPNWPVPFPKVLTNLQGHFNPLMGIYTAPFNGIYVFTFDLAVANRPLKVALFREFYPIIRNTEGTHQSITSQTVILHLTAGNRVWLQVKNVDNNGMYTAQESTSTFSGYLLHPDSCELLVGRTFHSSTSEKGSEVYGWNGNQGFTTHKPWEGYEESTTATPI